jgi:hypothetical protein
MSIQFTSKPNTTQLIFRLEDTDGVRIIRKTTDNKGKSEIFAGYINFYSLTNGEDPDAFNLPAAICQDYEILIDDRRKK